MFQNCNERENLVQVLMGSFLPLLIQIWNSHLRLSLPWDRLHAWALIERGVEAETCSFDRTDRSITATCLG